MESGLHFYSSAQFLQMRNRSTIDTEVKSGEYEELHTGDSGFSIPSSPGEYEKEPPQFRQELELLAGILIAIKTDSIPELKARSRTVSPIMENKLKSEISLAEEIPKVDAVDDRDPSYSHDEMDSDSDGARLAMLGTSDEEFVEEDDEEWIEQSRNYHHHHRSANNHIRSPTNSNNHHNNNNSHNADPSWRSVSSSQRTPRKKAPSGTACERHKRWKKKCPNDCPWKTSQGKAILENLGITVPSPTTTTTTNNNNNSDHHSTIHHNNNDQQHSSQEDHPEEDDYSDEYSNHNQHNNRSIKKRSSSHNINDYDDDDDAYYPTTTNTHPRRTVSEGGGGNNKNINKSHHHQQQRGGGRRHSSSSSSSSSSNNAALLTVACEQHTISHARCPPDCPERRPAKPHPRSKRARMMMSGSQSSSSLNELAASDAGGEECAPARASRRAGRKSNRSKSSSFEDEFSYEDDEDESEAGSFDMS